MTIRGAVLATALVAWSTTMLAAQVSVHLGAGARYSSILVRDSIVQWFEVQAPVAPTAQVALRHALRDAWIGHVTLDVTPSVLRREEGGASFDAGSFTTIAFSVGLGRPVAPGLTARVGLGGLIYLAADEGIFRQGTSGIYPAAALGVSYALPFGAARGGGLELDLRYDVHRFQTPALRGVQFNNPRPVHRLAVSVSARLLGGVIP